VKIKQKFAALGVGVALLGGGSAVALATSGASSAATAPSSAPQAPQPGAQPGAQQGKANGGRSGALMRRVVHGDLTVRTKNGFEKVTYDRGTVTAKDGSSITLKRPDGVAVTVKVADTTRYKGVQSLDQVQVDKPAIVLSKDGTALTVAQRSADNPGRTAPARSGGAGATPAGLTDDPLA
jgi:hypothetical protein